MSSPYPLVPLGEAMDLSIDTVVVDSTASYPISGVYSFGRGLFARESLVGSETTYKVFHRLHANDFVLSKLKAWEGAIAKVPASFDGWYLSPQFPTFRANPHKLDVSYLDWYCKQTRVWDALRNKSRGMGARRDSVSPKTFLALDIPLPPLPEQRRIVARIEQLAASIGEARGLRRRAVEEAEALVDTELDNVFTAISVKTETLVVGKEGGFVTSGPRGWGEYYDEGGDRRLIRVENVWNRELDLSTAAKVALPDGAGDIKRSEVRAGDVLVTITGAIGRVGVVRKFDLPCHVSQHVALVRPPKSVYSDYLYWFLQSPSLGRSQTEGATYGATKPGINLTSLRKLRLPALTFSEQKDLAAHFSKLQTKVDSLKRLQSETAAELDALLPSVLDRAFKGKL